MPSQGAPLQAHAILNLQRTIGNRATGRQLRSLQRQAESEAEQEEAVQAAPAHRQVEEEEPVQMLGRTAPVQRMCPGCEEEAQRQVAEEEVEAQTKGTGGGAGLDTEAAERAMARSDSGTPLGGALRTRMEGSFGAEFSAVRVHTGPAAQDANRAINARAFTRGADIYMGRGESATDTRLLAHELAHVVQQTGAIQRQPEAQPAEKANVTDLRQDMERQIDNWKEASRAGIGEFVHAELASQIDALSEGNWESFFQQLVGNTVWAAAAFAPVGAPAFAVSMIGIFVGSGASVPKKGKSKGELTRIEDRLHTYIEKIHEKLNKQLPTCAATLLKEHPGVSLEEYVKLFLEASFKPGMIKHNPPMIDETAVRQKMRESAAYSLALLREVSKKKGRAAEIHTSVAWLYPPDYGDKKLAVVVSAPIGSDGVVKFLRWVPQENEALAQMTQRSQPIGVESYFFWLQAPSYNPQYLMWLIQHGWKSEDGFGLEWSRRKERKAKAAR